MFWQMDEEKAERNLLGGYSAILEARDGSTVKYPQESAVAK